VCTDAIEKTQIGQLKDDNGDSSKQRIIPEVRPRSDIYYSIERHADVKEGLKYTITKVEPNAGGFNVELLANNIGVFLSGVAGFATATDVGICVGTVALSVSFCTAFYLMVNPWRDKITTEEASVKEVWAKRFNARFNGEGAYFRSLP